MNEYLKSKLKARLADEKGDIDVYKMLAKDAEEQGCHHLARYLEAIAHDEHTHAEFLEEYLHEYEKKD